jgi:hypothetical protein
VQSAKAGVLGEQLTPAQLFETMAPPVPLTSSWLEWVSYSEFNQTMIIGFKGDVSFAYYTVPPSLFEGLVSASSPGKYFHKYIMHLYTGHRV